jgi:hypothetical protein
LFSYRRTRATNVTANGASFGIAGVRLIGSEITANNNSFAGIGVPSMRVTDVTALGNGRFGVYGRSTRIVNGTILNNVEYDVFTARRPRLTAVTCGWSGKVLAAGRWGVCENDD